MYCQRGQDAFHVGQNAQGGRLAPSQYRRLAPILCDANLWMLIRHAPCFSKSVGLGKKHIEPVVQKTYQTLDPSLKLKVTQLLQKCRIAKKHNKKFSSDVKTFCLS